MVRNAQSTAPKLCLTRAQPTDNHPPDRLAGPSLRPALRSEEDPHQGVIRNKALLLFLFFTNNNLCTGDKQESRRWRYVRSGLTQAQADAQGSLWPSAQAHPDSSILVSCTLISNKLDPFKLKLVRHICSCLPTAIPP